MKTLLGIALFAAFAFAQAGPGLGGVPLTGITRQFTTQIEALGVLVGPPINTGPTVPCDRNLLTAAQGNKPRSQDEPTLEFSCAHIGRLVVTQIAYKSKKNGNAYFSDLNGTYKLKAPPPGLPEFDTDDNGSLTALLDPTTQSINWVAGGAQCYYTPGDTASQYYGALQDITCGAGSNGRVASLTPAVFCQQFPNDATCKIQPVSDTTMAAALDRLEALLARLQTMLAPTSTATAASALPPGCMSSMGFSSTTGLACGK